jgi:hypothetical protein
MSAIEKMIFGSIAVAIFFAIIFLFLDTFQKSVEELPTTSPESKQLTSKIIEGSKQNIWILYIVDGIIGTIIFIKVIASKLERF